MAQDKWPEGKGTESRIDYAKARWAAMGEGMGQVIGKGLLTTVCVGLMATIVLNRADRELLNAVLQKQFVVIERTPEGKILGAVNATGQLQTDTAVEQWLISDWIDKVRGVPLDPIAFNRDYFKAQEFMCSAVQQRIAKTMEANPDDPARLYPEIMMKQGMTRRVHVTNVTPRGAGGPSNSYRLDWKETLYKNSQVVAQATLTADVELRYFTPESEAAAIKNPYGLYVCGFDSNIAPTS